jgi:hypothetical protein
MADVKYLQGIRRAATSDTLMRLDGLIPKEHRSAAIAGSRSVLPPLHGHTGVGMCLCRLPPPHAILAPCHGADPSVATGGAP